MVHEVKSGETLSKIAQQNGLSVQQLMAMNNITDPNKIQIGQKLNVQIDQPQTQGVETNVWKQAQNWFRGNNSEQASDSDENGFLSRVKDVWNDVKTNAKMFNNAADVMTSKGSPIRQYLNMKIRKSLPDWMESKPQQLKRKDFTNNQKEVLDYILNQALTIEDGARTVAGQNYMKGYAPGNEGYQDQNVIERGIDVLFSGNKAKEVGWSIGGGRVMTHTLPNGKRIALLTDHFNFDKDTDQVDENQSKYSIQNSVAGVANERPSSYTRYAISSDGSRVTNDEIQQVLDHYSDYEWNNNTPKLKNRVDLKKYYDAETLI